MARTHRNKRTALRLGLAGIIAGGAGFGAGAAGYQIAHAVPDDPGGSNVPFGTGSYTYKTNDCVGTQRGDPINVLFINGGWVDRVKRHADDHGDWGWGFLYFGSQQWFREYHDDLCGVMDAQVASAPENRYHMRIHLARNFNGDPLDNVQIGIFSSADAHFEVFREFCPPLVLGIPQGNHSVMDQGTSYNISGGGVTWGGFNRGRENIWYNWTQDADHPLVYSRDWDNEQHFTQCDPKDWANGPGGNDDPDVAWSDGYVYYIGAKHA